MTKIKKFTAASIPEALNLVRREMGEEALILGTSRSKGRKGRPGGVEVVAARDGRTAQYPARTREEAGGGTKEVSHSKEIREMRKLDRDIVTELKQIEARLKDLLEGFDRPSEVRNVRVLPLNRDLVSAGFDAAMLEGRIPASLLRSDAAPDQLVKAVVGGVSVARTEDRILVFLGPSGSGKTTTLLKVARSVFLVNNVEPRVVFFGPKDEDTSWLKAQCKRLGLKFRHISRMDRMAKMLKKEKAPILVDTPGISDLGDAEMRFLVEASREIPGMGLRLVVDATMDPWNACAIASCIPQGSSMSLVLTKLDEATRIGGAVTASIASGIPVSFVTGGRDTGDGVHVPDAELLSEKILDGVKSTAVQGAGGRG